MTWCFKKSKNIIKKVKKFNETLKILKFISKVNNFTIEAISLMLKFKTCINSLLKKLNFRIYLTQQRSTGYEISKIMKNYKNNKCLKS